MFRTTGYKNTPPPPTTAPLHSPHSSPPLRSNSRIIVNPLPLPHIIPSSTFSNRISPLPFGRLYVPPHLSFTELQILLLYCIRHLHFFILWVCCRCIIILWFVPLLLCSLLLLLQVLLFSFFPRCHLTFKRCNKKKKRGIERGVERKVISPE